MPDVSEYIREINRLSEVEQDPVVRDFFGTIVTDPVVDNTREIIGEVCEARESITTEHLPYLLFISAQYVTGFKYDESRTSDEIQRDLSTYQSKIVRLCVNRNSATNVIRRYSHLQIILEVIDHDVSILDVGTSMGLGLLALNTTYVTSVDISPSLRQYLTASARIADRIGIDPQPQDLKWMVASYLPEQKEARQNAISQYKELQNKNEIEFHQFDLFDLPHEAIPPVDIIWTSSMRYQVSADCESIRSTIEAQLSDDGLWIDANYRDPKKPFKAQDNPYVTRVFGGPEESPLEVLHSPTDEIKTISLGPDFETFVAEQN